MNFQTLVLEKLDAISADVAFLRQDVEVLKQKVAVLEHDVAVLREDVASLKEELREFKVEMREFKLEMYQFRQDTWDDRRVTHARLERLEDKVDANTKILNQLWDERKKAVVGLSRGFAAFTFGISVLGSLIVGLFTGKVVLR